MCPFMVGKNLTYVEVSGQAEEMGFPKGKKQESFVGLAHDVSQIVIRLVVIY